uniref:Uncharacterized protein n=1 Tax=Rhizophora mucronata TaxID=61149 RepID=A0A2P2PAP6_RHIMU
MSKTLEFLLMISQYQRRRTLILKLKTLEFLLMISQYQRRRKKVTASSVLTLPLSPG